MSKEATIQKINTYGKIGKIITIILAVLVGLSTFVTIVGGIVLKVMPNDLMVLRMDNVTTAILNPAVIDSSMPTGELQAVVDAFNNGTVKGGVNLGAVSFAMDHAELKDGTLVLTSSGNVGDISLDTLSIGVFVAAIALILTFISLLFGAFLCRAFEVCESPFDNMVIKKMRNFAFSLLPWAVFSSVPDSVMNSILNNSLRMRLSLDENVIFTVLIILALTVVFKYGAELQRESDETL